MEAFHADRHVFERDERRGISFLLALAMHGLLVLFLYLSVNWSTHRVETVSVELWGSPPPAPVVEAAPQPEPKPVPKIEPTPQPEPVPVKKPEIVEQKVKPKPVEKPKPQPASPPKAEIKKPEPKPELKIEKKPEPKKEVVKKSEPKPSEFDQLMQGALSDLGKKSEIARPNGKPGGIGTNPKAVANVGQDAGGGGHPGNDYLGQVVRLIKSNLVYPDNKPDSAKAKIKVFLLPDGTIRDAQLLKSIGDPAYAEAARRAVMTTHTFPPQPGGKLFSGDMREWTLSFCAKDSGDCRID
ncbi:MAG: TonB family protein [Formivibrio sp.]|nr:TonB family protein [Formivibrio sp.]